MIEFEIEIKPVKLVRGRGLAKLLAEDNCKMIEMNYVDAIAENLEISEDELNHDLQVSTHIANYDWYSHIIFFLQNLKTSCRFDKDTRKSLEA